MTMMVLRTISRPHNQAIIKALQAKGMLRTDQITNETGLSRKSLYSSLFELKKSDLVKRWNGFYMLTDFATAILIHVHEIEKIEQARLQFKVREIIKTDSRMNAQEKVTALSFLTIKLGAAAGGEGIANK